MKRKKEIEFKNFIKNYKLSSFNNKKKVNQYIDYFNIRNLLKKIPEDRKKDFPIDTLKNVIENNKKPYLEDFNDLCRLHWLVLKYKMLNILEFGSGYSTVFMAHALSLLKKQSNYMELNSLRVKKKFFIYSLDESKRYIRITKKRLTKKLNNLVELIYVKNKIINYEGKYATITNKIPNISPDLIYLDGPSTFATKEEINGFKINDISRFPMSCDILFIEYFLEPGTIIIVDGRTANARFLKDHFKRNWKYFHNYKEDFHLFILDEKPLGKYNERKLKFKNLIFKNKISIPNT